MKIKKIKECNDTVSSGTKNIEYCVSNYKNSSETMKRNLEINILNNLDNMEYMIRQMKKEMEEISEREDKIQQKFMAEAMEALKGMDLSQIKYR